MTASNSAAAEPLPVVIDDATLEETASSRRDLTGWVKRAVGLLAVALSAFHLYTAGFGVLAPASQRGVHLTLLLVLVFLLYPATKKSKRSTIPWYDVLCAVLALAVTGYTVVFQADIAMTAHLPMTKLQYVMGWIFILLVLEAARRVVGMQLVVLVIVFLLYGYFGKYIPGSFGHSGFSWTRIVRHMFLTQEGIFGVALGVSSTYIILFILFGSFLEASGMAKFFNDSSMAVTGHSPGGPAKVAIIFSMLLGMISGSAPANVATTGAFTIPMMKKVGYTPAFAGSVEAVASTGGQIMPPIMGAVAFLMADMCGLPYWTIALSAFIPGFLYYFAVFITVHIRAKKLGLRGVDRSELPSVKTAFKQRGHLIIPIALLIYLLVIGYSPMFAAFWSIICILVVSWFSKATRITPKMFLESLEKGAYSALGVGIACAVVGIVVGVVSLTSIGMVFGNTVMRIGENNVFLSLVLTMLTVMVLGMGVPTVAAYVIATLIAVPGLQNLGVPLLAIHMFILYFSILATITPPVAISSYTAAAIAGSNPNETGWVALKLALPGFIIPYTFVYSPVLLLIDASYVQIGLAFITACLGIVMLACSLEGYMLRRLPWWSRIILFGGALGLIFPGLQTDLLGLACFVPILLWQKLSAPAQTVE